MDLLKKTSKYLGRNIETLRSQKNLSQSQLAKQASIPRSTLTNLESGVGNPSLKNLIKISLALGVSIEELLSKPRANCALIKAKNVPVHIKQGGKVKLYKLLPDKLKGIEIDRLVLAPQAIMGGHPHLEGTKEYMTVIQGEITIHVAGDSYIVKQGDIFAFPGNTSHSYRNNRKTISTALCVVIPVPVFM